MTEKHKKIHIIHMNDLHSYFENMPKISTYIQQIREKAIPKGESVIVVDLGDHMDRVQMETEGTGGKVNVEILNRLGVDVVTIGNNEGLTFTKELLTEAYKEKKFKVVACNLKDRQTLESPEWLEEYWIQEVDDVKIGWIGATVPYETFYQLQGWDVEEPVKCIRKIVKKIKSQVDIIILLSHLGIKGDEYIAEALPEIDVIFGAHTHRLFENGIKKENQPLICQVGIFGDLIGHLTIDYHMDSGKRPQFIEKTVDIRPFSEDQTILNVIEHCREAARIKLNEPVAFLEAPLGIAIEEERPLGNLLADGVRNWVNAEIGLINTGQLLESLNQGMITKQRIHEICPSPINACRLLLKGSYLKTTLEQSLLDEFIYKPFKGYGFRGKELGTLSLSGLKVYYHPSAVPYQKIKEIYVGEELLEDEKEYIIGTLDMFTFGGGYYLLKEARNIEYFLPEFIRDILAVQLINQEAVKRSFQNRWLKINE